MPRQTRPPEGIFAERLDLLFRTIHPKDRGPYTPAEAADAINRAAGEKVVSGTYLWLLRTGQLGNYVGVHTASMASGCSDRTSFRTSCPSGSRSATLGIQGLAGSPA